MDKKKIESEFHRCVFLQIYLHGCDVGENGGDDDGGDDGSDLRVKGVFAQALARWRDPYRESEEDQEMKAS